MTSCSINSTSARQLSCRSFKNKQPTHAYPRLSAHDLAELLSRAGIPSFADEIRRLMSAPLL